MNKEKGKCYVVVDNVHIDIVQSIAIHKDIKATQNYPENNLCLFELINYQKSEEAVLTGSPFIISHYKKEDVFIFRNGEWIKPDFETYGCSFNVILMQIAEVDSLIPKHIKAEMDEIVKDVDTGKEFNIAMNRLLDEFGESSDKYDAISRLTRKKAEIKNWC